MHQLRKRLTPSTLIATAALIAATSGTAIAAGEIITSPDQIKNGVVTEPKLADNSVTSAKIKNGAVTQDDQVNYHLRARIGRNGTVRGSQLDVNSVESPQPGVYRVSLESHNGKLLDSCAVTATPVLSPLNDDPVTLRVSSTASTIATVIAHEHRHGFAPRAVRTDFDLIAAC